MMRVLSIVLVCLLPLPALALSCVQPSVERSYAHYDAAEETYVVVHGRLTLNERKLPKGLTQFPPPPAMTHVRARLRGSALSAEGFVVPFDQKLTLEVACLGPWCGAAGNGTDVLAFVRKDSDGYAIEVSPCGGAIFSEPNEGMLDQARACFKAGGCTAD